MKRAASSGKESDAKRTKPAQVYQSGQHTISTGLCLATFLDGKPCPGVRANPYVPYCQKHIDQGDPSLKVVKHPKYGKMLVAARNLPSNYHMGLYGARKTKKQMSDDNMNWAFETAQFGFIDPDGYEAQLKYCQCPGPNEIVTVGFSSIHELIDKTSKMGSMMFKTKRALPKKHQLVMMYSDSVSATDTFFRERGITRADVGTPEYPCFRKKIPQWMSPNVEPESYPCYASGQHTVKSGRCIATFLDGKACPKSACENFVPYCQEHMRNGDPSMKVVKHPKYGKCLVAARELPPKYYMALYGDLMPKKKVSKEDLNWSFITDGRGIINPAGHDAQLKFCQCPGPDEIVTVGFPSECNYCEKGAKFGSMLFITKMKIPKNYQLVMMYAEDEKSTTNFFRERRIIRDNVGCPKYPCFLKKRAQK